jgi:hypothetical protein
MNRSAVPPNQKYTNPQWMRQAGSARQRETLGVLGQTKASVNVGNGIEKCNACFSALGIFSGA